MWSGDVAGHGARRAGIACACAPASRTCGAWTASAPTARRVSSAETSVRASPIVHRRRRRSAVRLAASLVATLAACQSSSDDAAPRPASRAGPSSARAVALMARADSIYPRDYDSARVAFDSTIVVARLDGDSVTLARALTSRGNAAWRLGRYDEAERIGRTALALKHRLRLERDLAKSYGGLGLLAQARGQLEQAEPLLHVRARGRAGGERLGVHRAVEQQPRTRPHRSRRVRPRAHRARGGASDGRRARRQHRRGERGDQPRQARAGGGRPGRGGAGAPRRARVRSAELSLRRRRGERARPARARARVARRARARHRAPRQRARDRPRARARRSPRPTTSS